MDIGGLGHGHKKFKTPRHWPPCCSSAIMGLFTTRQRSEPIDFSLVRRIACIGTNNFPSGRAAPRICHGVWGRLSILGRYMAKSILIVGGGVAGLSLSIALARQGWQPQIVEANPAWGVYGVGIILQSNALRALDSLGLAERCLDAGFPYSTTRYCDHNGVLVRERKKPNLSNDKFAASTGMLRPALHQILRDEALRLGVQVRLGVKVQSLDQEPDRVHVTLDDGTVSSHDLVVGADGLRSQIRKMVFPGHHEPRFMGQSCWRFTAPRPEDITCAVMYRGAQTQAGLIPLNADKMYLLLLVAEPGNPRMERSKLQELLAERLSGYGGLIRELAQALPPSESIVYSPLEPILMPPPWHSGRVVLVGDAAHATTPHTAQGASMAFEDAVVLTESLLGSEDMQEALQRFTQRRYERCRMIIENSLQIGRWQLQAWDNRPDPAEDIVGLSTRTLELLRAPI